MFLESSLMDGYLGHIGLASLMLSLGVYYLMFKSKKD